MKNCSFILCLILFIFNTAHAQQIGFGIKAGGNYSTIEGDWNKLPGPFDTIAQYQALFGEFATLLDQPTTHLFDVKAKHKFGAHAGIFFNIPISENFSIQPEIVFMMRGANYENTINLSGDSTSYVTHPSSGDTLRTIFFEGSAILEYDINYSLNYIDVPIMAIYKFNNGLTLSAGPNLSFLVSSKFNYGITTTIDVFGTQTDHTNNTITTLIDTTAIFFIEETDKSKDDLNTIDVGLIVGIGYEFPFGLGIHARYVRGLTEIYKKEKDSGFRNSVIQLGVSYKIFNDLFKFQ
jgi:hypothetical protein